MKNALTEILKSFSEVDFQKFEDFVNSPYHNKIKNACKLLIVLKNNLDEFDKGAVTKEELWKKLSPSKKYNYGTVKNLFHELHKLAEKFLVIESFTQSESEQFKHLYISLFDRNQYSTLDLKDKFLDMYYSDNKNNKSNDALRFIYHDLFYLFQIKMWKDHFRNPKLNMESDKMKMDSCFMSSLLISLFVNFSISKAYSLNDKTLSDNLNLSNFLLERISGDDMETILREIRKTSQTKYKVVKSYYLAYKAIANESDQSSYLTFKRFLFDNAKDLPPSANRELVNMLVHSFYYSKGMLNKDEEKLDILEFKFENNLFLQNNEVLSGGELLFSLKPFFDNNRADKFKEILVKYEKYLINENKETCVRIANAQYHFMKSEFDTSLIELSKINCDVFELKLIAKRLLLMIYYETGEYDLFLSSYDSYKHFTKNLKFNSNLRKDQNKRTRSFFDLINELYRLRQKFDDYKAEIMQKSITEMNIDHKFWLLNKLQELKSAN